MPKLYISCCALDDKWLVTIGFNISKTIKQPISSHIISPYMDAFPTDFIESRTLILNSILNGTIN